MSGSSSVDNMASTKVEMELLSSAFKDAGYDLCWRIFDAAQRYQGTEIPGLLSDIAHHVRQAKGVSSKSSTVHPSSTPLPPTQANGVESNSKKRKINAVPTDHSSGFSSGGTAILNKVELDAQDISFSVPARKKMRVQLVSRVGVGNGDHCGTAGSMGLVRLLDSKTGQTEHELDLECVDQVFCLPVPEKAQRQSNIVMVSKGELAGTEQVVFTLPESAPKDVTGDLEENDTFVTCTVRALNKVMRDKKVIFPDDNEFSSAVMQTHRKGEKAYHVKAHRGSKDGFLFCLSTGILFAFKKPLLYFPFNAIDSISYTSVLQRTFNLVVSATKSDESKDDTEFSMLDQADFAGIDEYIKRHRLNDGSMAAERRAKVHNVNKVAKAVQSNTQANGNVEEESELQKAQQEIEQAAVDEGEEEEEDYNPGSEGESEGEGESSDGEEEEEYGDVDDEEMLVEHEEDVEE